MEINFDRRYSLLAGSPNDPLVFERRCTTGVTARSTTQKNNQNNKTVNLNKSFNLNRNFIPLQRMIESGMFNQVNSLNTAFDLHSFAPVKAFHHAPMNDCWDDLFKNRVVVDIRQPNRDQYWRAELIDSFGYFIKHRYLGPGPYQGPTYFLANPRTRKLLPIIERDNDGKIIKRQYVPPSFMRSTNIDCIFQLSKNVTTLEKDLHESFQDCIPTNQYDMNLFYEIIDPMDASRFLICKIVCCFADWLLVRYEYPNQEFRRSKTVWIHPKSGFFRLPGWSQLVGYPIYAPNSYVSLSLYTLTKCDSIVDEYLVKSNLFPFEPNSPNHFQIGSYLELLDPFTHKMKIATVVRKLRFGFIVVEYEDQSLINPEKLTQIIQHVTSPLIFPIGFCHRNDIPIYVTNAIKFNKKMTNLAQKMTTKAAPSICFPVIPNNNNIFKQGMILETFNMVEYGTICYAMIDRVVDRLLSLRFINQQPNLQMWVEYTSPHIRPFGYSHMLNIDFKSPLATILIDYIKFAELHTIISEFKTIFKNYIKTMNTQHIHEVININNSNSNNNQSVLAKSINNSIPIPTTTTIPKPIITFKNLNSNHQILYKNDYENIDNVLLMNRTNVNINENGRGNYVHFPSIKIDTSKTYIDPSPPAIIVSENKIEQKQQHKTVSSSIKKKSTLTIKTTETNESSTSKKEKDTLVQSFARSPDRLKDLYKSFNVNNNNKINNNNDDDTNDDKDDGDENRFKKIKYDYSKILINEKRKENFGYHLSDNLINNNEMDKKELFLEFQNNVKKLADLQSPKLFDNNRTPIEWKEEDVEKFLKLNLTNYDDFKFNPSMKINGKKFLQMDHNQFNNELLLEPSMSLAIQLNVLKVGLIEHFKLDLKDIFDNDTK